jgi:glycosyltransferase involved in cell wall biosynthesis
VRLGIYADLLYRADGEIVSTDRAFVLFLTGLAERVDDVVLFGRLDPAPGRGPHQLPKAVRLVPLPHYERVSSIGAVLRAAAGTRRTFAASLPTLDAVWLFGPHPLSLALVRTARKAGVPVFLGVRQDFPRYVAGRLPSRRWAWAVPLAHVLEAVFRLMARRLPTVVIGQELARTYGRAAAIHVTGASLVPASEIVDLDDAVGKAWDGDLVLLSVGRLDGEKNPLLLPEILARLRRDYPRWRLLVVGEGPLQPAVAARAHALGVADRLDFAGYVPFGRDLLRIYRNAHVFLHVSLTEGIPQVLFEAQASGLPIVATDVGGVGAALGSGKRGLLVRPDDAGAAAAACERLRRDAQLRRELMSAGLEFAARESIDVHLDRLVAFFGRQLA